MRFYAIGSGGAGGGGGGRVRRVFREAGRRVRRAVAALRGR